jgi:hypothetical protein
LVEHGEGVMEAARIAEAVVGDQPADNLVRGDAPASADESGPGN